MFHFGMTVMSLFFFSTVFCHWLEVASINWCVDKMSSQRCSLLLACILLFLLVHFSQVQSSPATKDLDSGKFLFVCAMCSLSTPAFLARCQMDCFCLHNILSMWLVFGALHFVLCLRLRPIVVITCHYIKRILKLKGNFLWNNFLRFGWFWLWNIWNWLG